MTTLFLCIQNAYVASLSALLVESVCTHLVYGSRQQYQLGCGVSSLGETTFFWILPVKPVLAIQWLQNRQCIDLLEMSIFCQLK